MAATNPCKLFSLNCFPCFSLPTCILFPHSLYSLLTTFLFSYPSAFYQSVFFHLRAFRTHPPKDSVKKTKTWMLNTISYSRSEVTIKDWFHHSACEVTVWHYIYVSFPEESIRVANLATGERTNITVERYRKDKITVSFFCWSCYHFSYSIIYSIHTAFFRNSASHPDPSSN